MKYLPSGFTLAPRALDERRELLVAGERPGDERQCRLAILRARDDRLQSDGRIEREGDLAAEAEAPGVMRRRFVGGLHQAAFRLETAEGCGFDGGHVDFQLSVRSRKIRDNDGRDRWRLASFERVSRAGVRARGGRHWSMFETDSANGSCSNRERKASCQRRIQPARSRQPSWLSIRAARSAPISDKHLSRQVSRDLPTVGSRRRRPTRRVFPIHKPTSSCGRSFFSRPMPKRVHSCSCT